MSRGHSTEVERALRRSGWFEGRRIDLAPWIDFPLRPHPAATKVLAEFGGLHFGVVEDGVDFATSDVDLRPSWPNRQFTGFHDLNRVVGEVLYPLGQIHRANADLLIDESGRVYMVMDKLQFVAPTFRDALEALLLGKRWSGAD